MSLHKRVADRAGRRAELPGRKFHAPNFLGCPTAKTAPLRIVAAPEFIAFATNPALGVQLVITALKCVQLELERPVVVRASDHAVPPELLHDLMRLFS